MEPHSMDVPLKLRGNRQMVFGNLDEIYKFHKKYVQLIVHLMLISIASICSSLIWYYMGVY